MEPVVGTDVDVYFDAVCKGACIVCCPTMSVRSTLFGSMRYGNALKAKLSTPKSIYRREPDGCTRTEIVYYFDASESFIL